MPAPPCTQNRLYPGPLFPSLWASAPKPTHPLKCPPERSFAPARLPHSGPLNTAKLAASSDRASLPPVPACSQSCSANSRVQALPLQLWLQSFRSLQIASCSFSFSSCEDVSATAQGSMLSLLGAGYLPRRFPPPPSTPQEPTPKILKAGSLGCGLDCC